MMRTAACVLLVVYTFSSVANGQNEYCRICSSHTLCIYNDIPGPNCTEVISSGVTEEDKAAILSAHNFYRAKVASGNESLGNPGPQPSASNMRTLRWDNELYNIARVWSKQCTVATDWCRDCPRFPVGQNIYWFACSGGRNCNATVDWRGTVASWYSGVRSFSRNDVDPFVFTSAAGTYTQVVWATTSVVGCSCMVWKDATGWINKLYVCDYGSAGNVVGSSMYRGGAPCTRCPSTCSADRTLCN